MNIQGISIIATYGCNASCGHCFFGSSTAIEYLEPGLLSDSLSSLNEPLSWLHFTGGEPLLRPGKLFELLNAAKPFHDGSIGLATNGFWGASSAEAKKMVGDLLRRGVDGISLSVDVFHQQTVPFEAVRNAALAVSAEGMSDRCWLITSLLPDDHKDAEGLNRQSLEMVSKISGETGIPVAKPDVRSIGRGSEIAKTEESGIPMGPCRDLACCLGETGPFDPRMVWLDPPGNVLICYGISIGTILEDSLQNVIDTYNPRLDPILSRLADRGPFGLYEFATELGQLAPGGDYRDECDLCFHARRALQSQFPDTLRPAVSYPDS